MQLQSDYLMIFWNSMKINKTSTIKTVNKILTDKRLVRYFTMAVVIVFIELAAFQIIYLASVSYYMATILSFIIGTVLNWIFCRKYVFGASRHSASAEFLMILGASIVGVLIQLMAVYIIAGLLKLWPLIGKILSLLVSFFWNYWFRNRFIFNEK